jgi:hypothetical protein
MGDANESERRADAGAGTEGQRGLDMLNRDVGLARPIPEHAADVPAAREIRVERQSTVSRVSFFPFAGTMRYPVSPRAATMRAARASGSPRAVLLIVLAMIRSTAAASASDISISSLPWCQHQPQLSGCRARAGRLW